MSDLLEKHIVGFLVTRPICLWVIDGVVVGKTAVSPIPFLNNILLRLSKETQIFLFQFVIVHSHEEIVDSV